jgi:hypothetical protein
MGERPLEEPAMFYSDLCYLLAFIITILSIVAAMMGGALSSGSSGSSGWSMRRLAA